MNGYVTEEGVRFNFEWIKRVGIGGVQSLDAAFEEVGTGTASLQGQYEPMEGRQNETVFALVITGALWVGLPLRAAVNRSTRNPGFGGRGGGMRWSRFEERHVASDAGAGTGIAVLRVRIGVVVLDRPPQVLNDDVDAPGAQLGQRVAQYETASDGEFQVQPFNPPHLSRIFDRCGHRRVVHVRAQNSRELRLSCGRQCVCSIHQRSPPGPSRLWSAPGKKSISSVCWPIFAYSSFRLGPSSFGGLTEEKFLAVPSSTCNLHSVVWFGCTSNRSASRASVTSPLDEVTATVALKAAE
jgi:hypothetical protein